MRHRIIGSLLLLCCSSPQIADAKNSLWDNWTYGISTGFGGAGIGRTVLIDDEQVEISRSENPGFFALSLNKMLTDRWAIGIEHVRGMRLGPFSLGVGFTGPKVLWYFWRNPPVLIDARVDDYVFLQKWAPYVGGNTGIAAGTISRENDVVDEISASGVYVGIRAGIDFLYRPNILIRAEAMGSTTLFDSGNLSSSLSSFGATLGIVFSGFDGF